jgi:hypothetical protein
MPLSARLTKLNILVVGVAQSANGRSALLANHPHFTTGQDDSDPIAFLGQDSRCSPGASNQLSAPACSHFDIMNLKPRRDARQRHSVAGLRLTRVAAFHAVTYLYAERTKDIPFFPVRVMEQRYEAIPVRVILDAGHFCRHFVFVSLKIDAAVNPLRAAASEAAGSDTMMVSSTVARKPYA